MSVNRLGRGLDALIPTDIDDFVSDSLPEELKEDSQNIAQVDISKVVPNPHQPRTEFSESDLKDLSDSIKVHGIIQPLVVIKITGGKYQLVAGERRLRASKLIGLQKVPAIVRTFSEQEQLELAVIENIQRAELKPLEVSVAYTKLIEQFNLTHDQIAERVGKGSSTVSNSIRLLNLPHAAKIALQKGSITEGHARAILSIEDNASQTFLLEEILKSKLTVREAEEAARRLKKGEINKKPVKAKEIRKEHMALTNSLGKFLGTKVGIQSTAKGGRLVIEYYSDEELGRIIEQIKN
ncbi:chromosome partitioning protein ParB [Candidatus Saccharibacteria bacterium]|nr:chromosome partitioning protein ParB [Candidatus Saccharibacteria bacterium]